MVEKKPQRRKVLKGIGAGIGSFALLNSQSKARANPDGEHVGIAYDTLTKEESGRVTGNIISQNGSLSGAINIAGMTVPLNRLKKVESPRNSSDEMHVGSLTNKGLVRNNTPLKVQIERHDNHYSGMISRPSNEFGMLGFFTRSQETGMDPDELISRRRKHSRWKNSPHSFSTEKSGLPTDTGVKRLMELAKKKPLYDMGDK
ncbi:hypothetical protein [Halomarina oriensis]|uniref:Uncharacterized protein n=1 Tax=Halomarina oriensis TaxID=671145 RepID=A0A6B0GR97_9EURY|nr:hypothetical protein [Halomarina oriensis]MWG36611.1 hypothetical protein [Halomarina oriensis]